MIKIIKSTVNEVRAEESSEYFAHTRGNDASFTMRISSPTVWLLKIWQKEAADCFADGLITSADAKVMQRYIPGEYKTLKFYS